MQRFALIRPESLTQAREIVREKPETRELRAGGIDLLDRMKEGLSEPELVVDLPKEARVELGVSPLLNTEEGVDYLAPADRHAMVSAATTLAELAAAELPGAEALTTAAGEAATPGIRNTATVGGNLLQRPRCWYFRNRELVCLKKGGDACLAIMGDNRYNAILGGGPSFIVHPSSLGAPLLALDASVVIAKGKPAEGEARNLPTQAISIADLFVGPKQDPTREHCLAPGEILIDVVLPLLADMRSAYGAVREKHSHDWPLVEAAVRMRLDGGVMRDVRVALGHVAPIPWLAPEAAELLEGQKPDEKLFAEAAEAALAKATPLSGNAYKVPMSKGLLREVLHQASGLPLPA